MFGSLYILTLSLSCIIYSLTYTGIYTAISVILIHFFIILVTLPVYTTRLSILWAVLRPSRLLVIGCYVLLGGGASYCLAELAGYHHLWSSHQRCCMCVCVDTFPHFCTIGYVGSYPHCLNEHLFFHYLHGLFMVR